LKQLNNRVAVITGAGSGIGRALSLGLAKEGCNLALVDFDKNGLGETQKLLAGSSVKATIHAADVTDRSRMESLPDEIINLHGRVNLLINNAGVGLYKTVAEVPIEDIEWVMNINFWGVVYGCKFFLPYLQMEDEAHIVNVSSLLGFISIPKLGPYSASKFAVCGFTEALWREMSGTGVGVSLVYPGAVKTNILNQARFDSGDTETSLKKVMARFGLTSEKAAKKIIKGIKRKKYRVRICTETYFMDWGKRFFPTLFSRLIS
jgi:hypothetical protein